MIKFNGKDVIPRFNGKDVSRVMFNGKQIYPNSNFKIVDFIVPSITTILAPNNSTINIKTSDLEKSGILFQAIYDGEAPNSVEVSYTFNGQSPKTFTLSKKQSSNILVLDKDVVLLEDFIVSAGSYSLSFTCGDIEKTSQFIIQTLPAGVYTPETAPNGVYIYRNNNLLYNTNNWNTANNDSAVGVAVINNNRKFVITKGEKPQRAWSDALYGTDVDGLTNYDSSGKARTNFNGENNTSIIREATPSEDASNNAAHYCYNQTISIDGRGTVHGYLPALGELQAAFNNKSAVDSAMSKIGGAVMPTGNYSWSSTECDADFAWGLHWRAGGLNYTFKNYSSLYAIPIYSLD